MFSTTRMGIGACLAAALAMGLPTHAPAERGKPYATVAKLDTDGDGLVSPEEWPKNMKIFYKVDKDQDGFLSPLDFATHWGMELPPPPGSETKTPPRDSARIPMIDAHSQVDCKVSEELVLKQLDKLKISRVLISVRGCRGWKSGDLEARSLKWAANSPDRISHLLTTKVDGWSFNKLSDKGITAFKRRAKRKGFIGMGEVLVQHAAHDTPNLKYPELDISLNDKRIRAAMAVARDKSWPVILHLELNDNEDKSEQTLKDLEEMLATYPDTPFVLIHMAQASVREARALLEKHKNLYFMTTHADDLSAALLKKKKSKKIVAQMGWINLFQGGCKIQHCPTGWNPDWKQLIKDYPSRFVLAFENVFPSHWKKPFEQKVGIWRRALKMLPEDVAHAVAHENAERLWGLPPAR